MVHSLDKGKKEQILRKVRDAETRMTKQNKASLFAGANGSNPQNSSLDNAVRAQHVISDFLASQIEAFGLYASFM